MKRIAFLFFLILTNVVLSQTDTIAINGVKFLQIVKTQKSEYGTKDSVLVFYRIENNTKKYLLKHYLYRKGYDCNNDFTDIGKMQVTKDSIVFETIYKQKGNDPIPTRSKQIYRVDAKGKLKLIYNKEFMGGKWVNVN